MSSNVILLAGLGFGDEGKGTITDYLVRKHNAKMVVRYNGGAQAGHNVIDLNGRHHTFSQFGSGTFIPGCQTHLSRFMMVNPAFLFNEEKHLLDIGITDAVDRLTVEREALITTPFHVATNRIKEYVRGKDAHGSCGMGIGETKSDSIIYPNEALYVRDLDDLYILKRKLEWIREIKQEQIKSLLGQLPKENQSWWPKYSDIEKIITIYRKFNTRVRCVDPNYLDNQLKNDGTIIFEGAQGVLLDEQYGYQPHTTWSNTTFLNASLLLNRHDVNIRKIGILRSFATRHGNGPFLTEDDTCREYISPNEHNTQNKWQGNFRAGHFDLVAAKYALQVIGGVDELAITHMDRIKPGIKLCSAYNNIIETDNQPPQGKPMYLSCKDPNVFIGDIEGTLSVKCSIKSYGPTANEKISIS